MTSKITIQFDGATSDLEINRVINEFTDTEMCLEVIESICGTRQPLVDIATVAQNPPQPRPKSEVRFSVNESGLCQVSKSGPIYFGVTLKESKEPASLKVVKRGLSRDLELTINPENYAGVFYFDKP